MSACMSFLLQISLRFITPMASLNRLESALESEEVADLKEGESLALLACATASLQPDSTRLRRAAARYVTSCFSHHPTI